MQQDLSGLVQDAEVHGAGVEVDAAVVLVLLGVESHKGLLVEGFAGSRSLPH